MGMESIRLDIFWGTNNTADKIISQLAQSFHIEQHYLKDSILFFKRKDVQNAYRLEHYIILSVYEPSKYMCLEACMSNYSKYLEIMCQVYVFMREKYNAKIRIGHEYIEMADSCNDLKERLESDNKVRYKAFLQMFFVTNVDMLPGSAFYTQIARVRRRQKRESKNIRNTRNTGDGSLC